MMRLIDADALKNKKHFTKEQALKIALNPNVPFSSHDTQHVFNTAQIEEMLNLAATAAITNAPTVQREGWVSVEDRLPEKDTRVLICDNESIEFGYLSEHGVWYGEGYGYDGDHDIAESVTHWQPLPAAPKE